MSDRPSSRPGEVLGFFREFVRSPLSIGAVAPSSRHLARAMLEGLDLGRAGAVVEYGPGTGAFTRAILSRLPAGVPFVAIERSPVCAAFLRAHLPSLDVVEDSVENVAAICARKGISEVGAVLSGLPWASFSPGLQDRALGATLDVLAPGAAFVTFAYLQGLLLPPGRRFRRLLGERFASVETSPVVWRNLPPAVVYRCRTRPTV
jgi:phospholipid N-methyltransferase